jgi:hypothetical protein
MATARVDWVLPALWSLAWIAALIVTWTVARREGRNAPAWVIAALLIGPLAWVLLAMPPAYGPRPGNDAPSTSGSGTDDAG